MCWDMSGYKRQGKSDANPSVSSPFILKPDLYQFSILSKISSMSLHMVLQIVDLVQQQATVVTVKSEISSMCLHMKPESVALV